jgi:cellulose synthase/poly-beta-1,6-N-acetylglucosamine synthase-like glycosyltransferase
MAVAITLLFVSLIGSTWAYFLYPLHLRWRARRASRAVWPRDVEPAVSLIIPVYNRESIIADKLRNTLALDYPADCIEILVVSDGSTDRTHAIVESMGDPRVRLIALPRGGKLVALQQAGRRARGEVLVFTDPRAMLDPGALRALMRPLGDPHVGGVSGARKVRRSRQSDALAVGETFMARYEHRIRQLESRIGSVHAGDAALYAIRRGLFIPAANPAQADDIAISARAILSGKRIVYAPLAVCRMPSAIDAGREFRRRVHAVNYTIRAIIDLRGELLRSPACAFTMLSHTIARDLIPLFLATGLLASAFLAVSVHAVFAVIVCAHLLLFTLAAVGWRLRRSRIGQAPLFVLPCHYLVHNLAGFVGILSVIHGIRPLGATPRRRETFALRTTR